MEQFGLEIPKRTVEIILKRISRQHSIKKTHGVYRRTGDLPNPQLSHKQASARRHIQAVLKGLQQFSQETIKPIGNDEEAIAAVCAFLAEFNVTCLRAYLRGTAIPQLSETHETDTILVSQYVQHIAHSEPERFNNFMVLAQGHMLANALLCPDLQNNSNSQAYKSVTFYFDTPLLLHTLGLEGPAKEAASRELITLLNNLGGKVAAFFHSCQEFQSVLHGVAANLESSTGRGPIVLEARKSGVTRSDLILLADSFEERLSEAGIQIEDTPRYIEAFQIDEAAFEQVLDHAVSYYRPRTRKYDVNSVRSIYTIRAGRRAPSIEKAKAVLITSNTPFAKAAWEFGKRYESSYDVSSAVTAHSLANIAWLKSPMGAPSVPRTQILALAYAALQPSAQLLNKYMLEIDRLEAQGDISERDHQLLRSSPSVYDELMQLTLGDDDALKVETITEALERVSAEIKKEEVARLTAEEKAHRTTQQQLIASREYNEKIQERVFWQCNRRANVYVNTLSAIIGAFMAGNLAITVFSILNGYFIALAITLPVVVIAGMLTLANFWFGSSVKQMRQWTQNWFLKRLLRKQKMVLGIDASGFKP